MSEIKQSGFSLLELLISMAISLILLSILLQVINFSSFCSAQILRALDLQQNARAGLIRMIEDLRLAGSVHLVKPNQIFFYQDGEMTSFYCDQKKQLIRSKNGISVPVANYINEIQFKQQKEVVHILLLAENGKQRLKLSNKIYLPKRDDYNYL